MTVHRPFMSDNPAFKLYQAGKSITILGNGSEIVFETSLMELFGLILYSFSLTTLLSARFTKSHHVSHE